MPRKKLLKKRLPEKRYEHSKRVATTAEEMALGAVWVAGADVGIATTGIAGPGGGTPEKPVGLVYIACCIKTSVRVKKLNLSGSRKEIRSKAADEVLTLLCEMLSEE